MDWHIKRQHGDNTVMPAIRKTVIFYITKLQNICALIHHARLSRIWKPAMFKGQSRKLLSKLYGWKTFARCADEKLSQQGQVWDFGQKAVASFFQWYNTAKTTILLNPEKKTLNYPWSAKNNFHDGHWQQNYCIWRLHILMFLWIFSHIFL